jgi:hypothetical protein
VTPDRDDRTDDEPAWHERTSTVVGASVGALAVIGLLWLAISWMVGGSDGPSPASQYYLEPSGSGTSTTALETTSTTETITSTSPPMTTDINPGDTSSSSTTPSTDTTTSFNPSNLPHTHTPTTYDDGRRRPTFNETRTLYPRP